MNMIVIFSTHTSNDWTFTDADAQILFHKPTYTAENGFRGCAEHVKRKQLQHIVNAYVWSRVMWWATIFFPLYVLIQLHT